MRGKFQSFTHPRQLIHFATLHSCFTLSRTRGTPHARVHCSFNSPLRNGISIISIKYKTNEAHQVNKTTRQRHRAHTVQHIKRPPGFNFQLLYLSTQPLFGHVVCHGTVSSLSWFYCCFNVQHNSDQRTRPAHRYDIHKQWWTNVGYMTVNSQLNN